MRTTLNIDDDLYSAVKELAHGRSESVGAVVSDLIRKGIQGGVGYAYKSVEADGLPVFHVSENSKILTLEDIKSMEDEG